MPEQQADSETPPADRDDRLETRRIRGLSKRLKKPLSLEAHVSLAESVETEDALQTHHIGETPAAPEPAAIEEPLATRRVVPKPQQPAQPPAHRENLLREATHLQNRYKILAVVGVGGMGAVYRAQDLRFPNVMRVCAVKEMINTATDPQVREMIVRNFEREASILATLNHPAIPQVYDYFTQDNRSYLVLEFVNGQDLEALLADWDGFLPEHQVVDWALQLCDVLTFLHNHKPRPIVFRDLKPSNIMLDDHKRIRLVDFGIAKLFESGAKGTMIGTEGYSPPEQYRGVAEPRGDVYALAATMHHLLSKQDPRLEPPFSFHERPIHKTNPTVSRDLVDILDKALEYDINKRWGSAEEFRRALLSVSGSGRGTQGAGSSGTVSFASGAVKPMWRFACEDEVRASVVVSEDVVYVPAYDHNVYALEADSGKFIWKYPTEGGIGSTPWVNEELVVFGSTDGVVYAVDKRSGRLSWTKPTKGKVYSSPVGEFGHIFIGSDDANLYTLHLASGREAWTFKADGPIRTRPLIAENMIIIACQAGMVYALNLNRDVRWRFRSRRGILSSPVADKGFVFVGSLDWNFYALDVRSGWAAWRYRTGGAIVSTPAAWENLVFFGSTDGYFYALDADAGRMVWRHQLKDQITGSPLVHGENVYFGGVDGNIYCMDARAGKVRWNYQTDGPITGTPVTDGNLLYVGSADHYVYALPA